MHNLHMLSWDALDPFPFKPVGLIVVSLRAVRTRPEGADLRDKTQVGSRRSIRLIVRLGNAA